MNKLFFEQADHSSEFKINWSTQLLKSAGQISYQRFGKHPQCMACRVSSVECQVSNVDIHF